MIPNDIKCIEIASNCPMLRYCGASAFSVFRSNQQSTIPALQVPLSSTSGIDSNKHNKHIRPQALEFSANDLGSEATCCCMDTCISFQIFDISWYSILSDLGVDILKAFLSSCQECLKQSFGMMCWGGRVRHHATVPHAETHEPLPSDHPWWPEHLNHVPQN